jgi:tetratricopeptide (TPR) repeat protein
MKKIIIGIALLALAGCNKFLDTLPDRRAELKTDQQIAQMLVSAYPTELPTAFFEIMSDNFADNGPMYTPRDRFFEEAFLFRDISETAWDCPTLVWQNNYMSIAAANTALEAIVEKGSPESLDATRAEALLCRAYCHYILAQTFCIAYNPVSSATDLGVPYMEATENTVKPHYERGTVAEVYAKINRDIEEALPHITDNYLQPKYHFNRRAAYSFASMFNLTIGEWEKSARYATEAIGENPSEILRDMNADASSAVAFIDRYYNYIDIEKPCNFMLLANRSMWGDKMKSGSRFALTRQRADNTMWQNFPWGSGIPGMANAFGGTLVVYVPTLGQIFEEDPMRPGTGTPHTILVPFNADETLITRAEAYAMMGEYDKAATDLSYWYYMNSSGNRTYTKEQISDYYSVGRTKSQYEDMHSRFNIQPGMQENLVRAALAVRRTIGLHHGTRWTDMKRHGIRLTREVKISSDESQTLVVEPYGELTAVQLPAGVLAAGMQPNPRPAGQNQIQIR